MPKLSIITINYNNRIGLLDTFNSVFSQTFTDFEYIVIDGDSDDGSIDLIKTSTDKISLWVSEKDRGIYHAMNKGIAQATGDYLLFLNSGDILDSVDVIQRMFKDEDGNVDLLYGDLRRKFPNGNTDIVLMPDELSFEYLLEGVLAHPATFISRRVFEKFGNYREDLKIVSDWAFTLKVFSKYSPSYKHKDIIVSSFNMDGISSDERNFKLIADERKKTIKSLGLASNKYRSFVKHLTYNNTNGLNVKTCFLKLFVSIKRLFSISRKISRILFNKKSFFQILRPRRIPIIINSFNRLTYLKKLINALGAKGFHNIIILDNNSSYQPLLDYYDSIPYRVIKLDQNYGHLALWDSGLIDFFNDGFFVYTDPDVLPIESCSNSFMLKFLYALIRYPEYRKVGFGIKLDDLPDSFSNKYQVLSWESKFWSIPIGNDFYKAHIDTTFALYEPFYDVDPYSKDFYNALRTGGSLLVKHLPWYVDSSNLSQEDKYYFSTANESATWNNIAQKFD